MQQRLQKLIANAGYGSRRWAEQAIKDGKVEVNNKIASLGDKANISDNVRINGRKINLNRYQEEETKVIVLNKKVGVICSNKDTLGRKSVYDLLPKESRWVMVGRLDINTSGLLIFTNNGDLANKLMHPSSKIDREYLVRVLGEVTNNDLKKLTKGVKLEDGFAKFNKVTAIKNTKAANNWYKVVIQEGRKREVRLLWQHLGLQVSRLIRISFGNIILPRNLGANKYIYLKSSKVKLLLESVGLTK
jgi:23S rRNA pseudouridine2605 synthase